MFHWLDWVAIGVYVAFALGVGTLMAKRASRSTKDFYLAGRSLPWWVAGTSIVATSFAADTPLVVTGWVRSGRHLAELAVVGHGKRRCAFHHRARRLVAPP